MKAFIKYIIIGFIIVFFSIAFTSTHNIQSIDDISYVVALGIDVGEQNNLKITFQFTKPTSTSGESGSSESAPPIIDSIEAESVDNAVNLMNTYTSKEINLSHCKLIVFSEELAKKGIKEEIYSFTNKVQVRPDTNIVVSTTSAKKYIESVKPSLENLVTKFYALLPNSSEYTGYTVNVELGQFMNKIVSQTGQPIAILGNIIEEGSTDFSTSSTSDSSSANTNASNENSQGAKNGIENIGVAVFKHDKFVGTLTPNETLSYLITTGEVKSCSISVPDPQNENNAIDLFFTFDNSPKINVYIINGTPYITLKIKADARISSVEQISGRTSEKEIREIERSSSNYLCEQISHYLYKTSKELHSDISNIGNYCVKEFKTLPEFEEYEWLERYQDAFFKVDCEVDVESGFLLVGS